MGQAVSSSSPHNEAWILQILPSSLFEGLWLALMNVEHHFTHTGLGVALSTALFSPKAWAWCTSSNSISVGSKIGSLDNNVTHECYASVNKRDELPQWSACNETDLLKVNAGQLFLWCPDVLNLWEEETFNLAPNSVSVSSFPQCNRHKKALNSLAIADPNCEETVERIDLWFKLILNKRVRMHTQDCDSAGQGLVLNCCGWSTYFGGKWKYALSLASIPPGNQEKNLKLKNFRVLAAKAIDPLGSLIKA